MQQVGLLQIFQPQREKEGKYMPTAEQSRGPGGKGSRKIWCIQVLFFVKACPSDKWKSLKEGRVILRLRNI